MTEVDDFVALDVVSLFTNFVNWEVTVARLVERLLLTTQIWV